jgi:predicted MarR family transcription regulator
MTYDLRRLRRRGLIVRVPNTHRYLVTPLGLRFSYLYTKLYRRLLKAAWALLLPAPHVPPLIRRAIQTLDRHFEQLVAAERLPEAAWRSA